jgi:hypothetical protein
MMAAASCPGKARSKVNPDHGVDQSNRNLKLQQHLTVRILKESSPGSGQFWVRHTMAIPDLLPSTIRAIFV